MEESQNLPSLLVVDDIVANLVAIETVLSDFPVRLLLASSGEQALEILLSEAQVPFVALLDVQMPEMDGYELAQLLRSSTRTRQMPIVFMSAVYQDVGHITRGYDSGAIDFLVKPVNEHILRAKLRILLELHEARSQQLREREQAFRMLFENAVAGIATHEMLFDAAGCAVDYRFLSANPAFELHTGLKRSEIIGRTAREVLPGIENTQLLADYAKVVATGEPLCCEQYFVPLDKHYLVNSYRLDKKNFAVTLFDISERKRAEEQLKQAASVFEYTSEGIMITDPMGKIMEVNRAFSEITGYAREEALGRNASFLRSEKHGPEFFANMWQTLQQKHHWYGEIWNQRKNGEAYAELLTISAVHNEHNEVQRYVALFSDITVFKEHLQQLEYIAHYDALTHLPNRLLLADRLQQAMAHARRYLHKVAVIYLDLDGFKAVNDTHGHSAGDELLIQVANRMKLVLRGSDTLSRLGGDEFVAVLPALADTDTCGVVLERLLATVCQPILFHGHELKVSASIGVSFYPQHEEMDADQVLRQADQAMYLAKQSGKNRYHVFDAEQDRHVRSRYANLAQIRQALVNNEFVLFYQPKVNMRSGQVIGVEALVRWQHPERGLLAPGLFLPIINNHSLLIELGNWVLHHALDQFELWFAAGLRMPISINIDGMQLKPVDFIELLRDELAQHPNVSHGDLELEVLESSALEDLEQVSKVLDLCRELGIHAALDDFGTGASSLSYLKRLPVQTLKIDQSFVRDMLQDGDDRLMIEGVLGLAKIFRRNVIAEGVETEAHGQLLLQLGCELAQGYGISRPMPAEQLIAWVANWRPFASWQQAA